MLLGEVLTPEQVQILRDILADLPARPEDKGTLFFTQLRDQIPPLMEFAANGPHVEAMAQLIGPNLRCWFDQFVVKPPHEDKAEFPWHQDNGYNAPRPDNNVTVWVALDDVTTENGCVWVVPGSHKKGLIPHERKSEASWHIEVNVEGNGTPVPLSAGHAVAFTGYTLHRSLGNKTEGSRRAFFLEYCDADATFSDGTPVNDGPSEGMFRGGQSPVIRGVSKF